MNIKFLTLLMTIAVLFAADARVFPQATPDEFLKVLNQAGEKSRASEWGRRRPAVGTCRDDEPDSRGASGTR
jgi:hypothetical protein